MADEFVRKEHFDEYVLRMGQGFAHAEKARVLTADATPGRRRAGFSGRRGYLTAIGLPGEPVAPFKRSGEKM